MRIEYGQPEQKPGFLNWIKRVGWFVAIWAGGVVVVGLGAELLKKVIFGW